MSLFDNPNDAKFEDPKNNKLNSLENGEATSEFISRSNAKSFGLKLFGWLYLIISICLAVYDFYLGLYAIGIGIFIQSIVISVLLFVVAEMYDDIKALIRLKGN